ncbi:MAG: twin-arginine translocation signal domain-containing protein, partial [Candidatus Sulfotelmatobacter sp.]
MKFSRRDFLATTAVASASLALDLQAQQASGYKPPAPGPKPKSPVLICAANGYEYLDRGYAVLT